MKLTVTFTKEITDTIIIRKMIANYNQKHYGQRLGLRLLDTQAAQAAHVVKHNGPKSLHSATFRILSDPAFSSPGF